jgi:hypothetical protein
MPVCPTCGLAYLDSERHECAKARPKTQRTGRGRRGARLIAWGLAGAIALLGVRSCAGLGYRRATVVEMAAVYTPDNLNGTNECQELWANLARYGVHMDKLRPDWNKIVLDSASALIEQGCVKSRIGM